MIFTKKEKKKRKFHGNADIQAGLQENVTHAALFLRILFVSSPTRFLINLIKLQLTLFFFTCCTEIVKKYTSEKRKNGLVA